jgi:lysophospholipase L1-like esterase
VLIQFGHNDEPGKGATRQTQPGTSYREFMTRYVEEARKAGMRPVLVTSLARRQFGDDGKIHSSLTPYVEVVKQIAKEKDVPRVDLHARSIELYERLGKAGCEEKLAPRKADGSVDNTHLTAAGVEIIAPLVVEELVKVVPEMKGWVK